MNLSISKIAPALISGNTVIFKPATQGSVVGIRIIELLEEAGLDSGIVSVVYGFGREIDDYLKEKYSLKDNFSKTLSIYSFSNNCKHCGALQGNHFILDHVDVYSSKSYKKMDIGSTTVLEYKKFTKFIKKLQCVGYLSGYHMEN